MVAKLTSMLPYCVILVQFYGRTWECHFQLFTACMIAARRLHPCRRRFNNMIALKQPLQGDFGSSYFPRSGCQRQLLGDDRVEVEEADHGLFPRDDTAAEGPLRLRDDFRRRLQVFALDGHHV
jgi:hypothetical protein